MKRTNCRRGIFLAPALALMMAGGLTACGADEEPQEPAAVTPTQDAQEPAEPEPEVEEPAEPEPEVAEPEQEPELSPSACLVGSWLADNDSMSLLFGEMIEGDERLEIESISGTAITEFDSSGNFSVEYRSWTIDAITPEGAMSIEREGVDQGTYTADDEGSLTMVDEQMDTVVTVNMGPMKQPVPGTAQTINATFECEGDLLTVTSEGETSKLHRQ